MPDPADESCQTLTITAVTGTSAAGATLLLSAAGITYTPPVDFTGTDTFSYTCTDNGLTAGTPDPKTATGTVSLTVATVVPRIVTPPADALVVPGGSAVFNLTVEGQAPFTYQ